MGSIQVQQRRERERENGVTSITNYPQLLPSPPFKQQPQPPQKKSSTSQVTRREVLLRSSEIAVLGAIFSLSGSKPEYRGVQKNSPSLALCPATKNCISTSIKSMKPDKFTPMIVYKKDDYLHVEYESPILGFVHDIEFWFPPGKKSIVRYRSASRLGNFDFDVNRKRIKALRLALEKKGWASEDNF